MTEALTPGTMMSAVPLFPLPRTVLFPGALLPLHIFEPRYRTMTEHVMGSDRRLCVGLILGSGSSDDGNPAVPDICGVGTVIEHQRLPDGRHNILVRGEGRLRIRELPFVSPYRRVEGVVLPSHQGTLNDADLGALLNTASRFIAAVKRREPSFELKLPKSSDAGLIADVCSHFLVQEESERQKILEALDIGERLRLCTEALAVQLALLSGTGVFN